MLQNKKNIVVHDYFENAEGGGRLCLILAKGLNSHLTYGFKKKGHPYFQLEKSNTVEFDLNCCTDIRIIKQLRLIRCFSRKPTFLNEYKTVIYSGFYSVCAVGHSLSSKNLYYCHTPPRFMYDKKRSYKEWAGTIGRPIIDCFIRYYRPKYEAAVGNMDRIVANSRNIKNRIEKHLGLKSTVVYPPCELNKYYNREHNNYYLSIARMDRLKRVDMIVRAFVQMPEKKLIVVSGGSDFERIQGLARGSSNIHIIGWVDENSLSELLSGSIATIYIPKDEDFGMSPVESMASGKPVIGVNDGGLRETIIDGETGVLISEDPTIEALKSAVRSLTSQKAARMKSACQARAKQFSSEIFLKHMRELIHS